MWDSSGHSYNQQGILTNVENVCMYVPPRQAQPRSCGPHFFNFADRYFAACFSELTVVIDLGGVRVDDRWPFKSKRLFFFLFCFVFSHVSFERSF